MGRAERKLFFPTFFVCFFHISPVTLAFRSSILDLSAL